MAFSFSGQGLGKVLLDPIGQMRHEQVDPLPGVLGAGEAGVLAALAEASS